jgi:RNA polymerase sigma factor (sigma-70 family)
LTGDGDRVHFERLVLPHLEDAYALARWIAGDRSDAEDIVQEACLRALRAITSYAGGNPRAWVLTIVRNTAYTWLTKNRSSVVIAVDDLDAVEQVQAKSTMMNGHDLNPESELIARADAAKLEVAITALPPVFREALVLRDVQGLDYREIAAVTQVPVGTVMSRLARARQRLIETLGEKER